MKKDYLFSLITACLFVSLCHAQVSDSLVRAIAAMPDDTVKVLKYGSLVERAGKDTAIDPLKWFDEGMKVAGKLRDAQWEADLWNKLGNMYRRRSQTEKALECYLTSQEISRKLNDTFAMAVNHNNIGNLYNNEGKYLKAITHLMASLKLFEESGNKARAASVMISIGNAYADQKMPEKALYYYQTSLKSKQQLHDSVGIISNLVNIGALYYDKHEYDLALASFKQGLTLSQQAGFGRGVFTCLNNIGQILYQQGRYRECLEYQEQSLAIRRKDGDKVDIAYSLTELGNVHLKLNETGKALGYFREALPLAKEMNSFENLAGVYDGLANAYGILGEHGKANQYMKLFMQFKDSLYNENTANQAAELETKYQTEKKDLEISRQNLELQNASLEITRKNTLLILLVFAIVAFAGFGYLFYNRYKLKQKALLNAELLAQQELRNKAIIEAEEKERIRIARDLHDGIGQQMSAVKMQLSAFESDLNLQNPAQKDQMSVMLSLVDEAVKEVRSVSHNMMPNALLKSGISAAFREFVNKLSSSGSIKIDLQITGLTGRLESTTETVLYRLLQECVSNIIKHAEATEISIQLLKHDRHLNMIIEDNGKGFDTGKMNELTGIGLKNMVSRVQFLNGSVYFDSYPGKGTTVNIDIPVSE